jgi:large subunit ribosomal protein L24
MRKLKKGDTVIVISGKSKGVSGKVLRVIDEQFAIVEGANLIKKHTRPNPNANVQGGIVEKEAPMKFSKLAILNPVTQKQDKVGIKILEDGRKVRYFKSNNELIDIATNR